MKSEKSIYSNLKKILLALILENKCVTTRAAEPVPEQFWMAAAGAKNFEMMESEPEIWLLVPQN